MKKTRNENYPYYEHKKLKDFEEFLELNLETPERVAFFFRADNEIISRTYAEFYNDVKCAVNYISRKYGSETKVAIIDKNRYEWIVAFFAIILAGKVAVVIDHGLDSETIAKMMKKVEVREVLELDEILRESVREGDVEKMRENVQFVKTDPEETAAIFFTSGTTGFNKGVELSQKNMLSDAYGASSIFKPFGAAYSPLPFHHTFGFITAILMPFYYGVPACFSSSLKDVSKDMKMAKATTFFVVPAFIENFYKTILKTAKRTGSEKTLKAGLVLSRGLSKLGVDKRRKIFKSVLESFGGKVEWIICGGAPLDEKYVKWFRQIGIEVLNGYGITECSPVVSVNRNFYHRDGSIGQACRDVEVKIIDDEVCVRGDIVMRGYYGEASATKEVIRDGWFHTGDFGKIDEDGFIYITGRKKNLIILSNGENISPEAVEAEILKDEKVAEAVVFQEENRLKISIFPVEEYLGRREYFEKLVEKYNKSRPVNMQIAEVILRETEHEKNHSQKILRNKVGEK